jgi:hypothetical protein
VLWKPPASSSSTPACLASRFVWSANFSGDVEHFF